MVRTAALMARVVVTALAIATPACGDDSDAALADAGDTAADAARSDGSPTGDGAVTAGADAAARDGATAPTLAIAPVFDGDSGYVEIPDDDDFSEPTTGGLTVEAWMRPDSLAMPNQEGSGYVHWLGKGSSGQHEWVSRMYQADNDEDRDNRISFYSFNLGGGLGAGSYFQDPLVVGEWIHYAGTFDDENTYLYKNGELRDSDGLAGYDITPQNGNEPVRIGTRDLNSFFQGAIARVAIYSTRLSEEQLAAHVASTDAAAYDALVLAEPSLVGYWKLNETEGDIAIDATGRRDGSYHGGVERGAAEWTP